MNVWEYFVIEFQTGGYGELDIYEFSDILNSYGEKGWEVVSTFSAGVVAMGFGGTRNVTVVLKRVKGGS